MNITVVDIPTQIYSVLVYLKFATFKQSIPLP